MSIIPHCFPRPAPRSVYGVVNQDPSQAITTSNQDIGCGIDDLWVTRARLGMLFPLTSVGDHAFYPALIMHKRPKLAPRPRR